MNKVLTPFWTSDKYFVGRFRYRRRDIASGAVFDLETDSKVSHPGGAGILRTKANGECQQFRAAEDSKLASVTNIPLCSQDLRSCEWLVAWEFDRVVIEILTWFPFSFSNEALGVRKERGFPTCYLPELLVTYPLRIPNPSCVSGKVLQKLGRCC